MHTSGSFCRSLPGRYIGHGMLFMLMLILFAFAGAAHAQSATVYVDDGFAGSSQFDSVAFVGNPAAACAATSATYGVDAFATITDALANVLSGGTVCVAAGTFAENVVINKSLTLLGPHTGVLGNNPARATGEAIIKPASGTGISINADGVVVDGFTVQTVGIAGLLSGVRNHIQILNTRFVNSTSYGIYVGGGSGPSEYWLIEGNLFDTLGGTSSTAIVMIRAKNLRILGNVIRNVTYQGVQLSSAEAAEVRGNNISETDFDGINVAGSENVVIARNTIANVNRLSGADRAAVRLYSGMTNVSVLCNVIDATKGGVALRAGSTGGLSVFHNAIVGGTSVVSYWTAGADIGSNWYGGSAVTVGGDNALGVNVADPLLADPTNGGAFDVAGCGDNTLTQIVAYAGNGQTTPINTAFGQPLVARVQDVLGGAVITPQAVTFSVPASGASASLSTVSGSTDYNGTLSSTATANGMTGSYAVVASSGSLTPSAGFALTNGKGAGTVIFAPLTAPYATAHAVTATMSPADTNVTCTVVSGVPAQAAAPGNYLVSASCEGDSYVASGTVTYVVTASTAGIEAVAGSAPVGVVTVDPQPDADAKKSYFSWETSGSAAEFVRAAFVIGSGNASPQAGDLALEYWDTSDSSWKPLALVFDAGTGTWAGVFGPPGGFPLFSGVQSLFRAEFQRGGRYVTTASLVGASSGLTLATSQPVATDVADIDLVGSGNAAGVVGVAVDTGYSLVNSGTAALSKGDLYPAEAAPNNENVRGRFFIEWDGGVLTPADPNGVGGNGSNCGAETCASPDVAVEFFDAISSSYQPIYNLRPELDGSNQPTGRLYGHFGATTSGGVPVPAGYSGTFLFRTTSKTHTGNYTVVSQVVGIDTGTVYAQAADQTIGIGTGNAASIEIVGDDFGVGVVGDIAYGTNMDGSLQVLVRDSGGNPVSGASVAFNAPASGASAVLSAGSCTTDSVGECHVTAETNDVAGSFVVEASIANGQFVEFDLTNFADTDPTQVQIATVSGDGQTAQVGSVYGLPLVAKVMDRFDNPLVGLSVEFSALATGASVTPAGVSATTDVDGLVDSGTLTANATAGGFTVTASVDALVCTSGNCSVGYALTNTAAGATNVALVSSAASAMVGTSSAYTLTATVTDDDSNPVPGVSVTLVGPSAGAGVIPALYAGITDNGGQVAHTFNANTIAGAFQVQAVVSGVTPTDVTLTNLAGAAATIVYVDGNGQSAAVGTAFTTDLTVLVVDQYGNPVADDAAASVTFTAPGTSASATVTSPATSGIGGIASTPATATSEVGSYSVMASFNGTDVAFALNNTTGSVTISDIVWTGNGSTSIAYDGSPKSATATVIGSSLTPSFTYNGSATAPTNAGSYQVIATIDDGNVYGTAMAMLTIDPAEVTLTFGDLGHVYDGTIKAATVATTPAGVSGVSLAYSQGGSPVTPINAGSYDVTATLANPNYVLTGTTTATLVISQATPQIILSDLNHLYDGTPKAATVTTVPAALASAVVVTYDGSTTAPSAIGTYAVVAALTGDPNYADTQATGTLVIGQPVSSVTVSKTVDRATVYTGLTLTWTIVVENAGPSSADVELLDALPSSVQSVHWTCIALGGATCGAPSGTGDISFTSTIPAGGTIVAVVSATVPSGTADGTIIENIAMVEWQSNGATATAMDSASTQVVPVGIFSDGFEEAASPRLPLQQLARDGQGTTATQTVALGVTAPGRPAVAMELLGASGKVVAWLDHLTVGDVQLVRVRTLDAKGAQQTSAWAQWSRNAVAAFDWALSPEGLTLSVRPVGTHAAAWLEVRPSPGSPILMDIHRLTIAAHANGERAR